LELLLRGIDRRDWMRSIGMALMISIALCTAFAVYLFITAIIRSAGAT
jgi:hypothetical protein